MSRMDRENMLASWAKNAAGLESVQELVRQAWEAAWDLQQEHVDKLLKEVRGCSNHHVPEVDLPRWAQTPDDVRSATEEQLDELAGLCGFDPGEPDECLACLAYQVQVEGSGS